MFRTFCKYLFLHKKAAIPGIGIFSIQRQAAKHDFSNKVFIAPAPVIVFTADSRDTTDVEFYSFVAHECQVSETEAVQRFTNFANGLTQNLDANRQANLPGMGLLSINGLGGLRFKPEGQLPHFFPDVAAERIVRQESERVKVREDRNLIVTSSKVLRQQQPAKAVEKKETWWMYAIILTVIGVAAIVYYYLQNGSLL